MPTDFRREVFTLCKKLQKNDSAQEIGTFIHNLSTIKESAETGKVAKSLHGDFAYLAKQSNNEFHGYLFLDDNIDSIDLPMFLKAEHLSCEERKLIEQGHKTLTRFVELCLSDIAQKSTAVAESMDPYFLYKKVVISQTAESLISDEEISLAVSAFKNGAVYKALMASNYAEMFSRIKIADMRALIGVTEKEINQSLGEDIATDLKDFSFRFHSSGINPTSVNITDVMIAFSILISALRKSLQLSCRLLYRAICGADLFVLNNDNIINIEKKSANAVCEFYKVLAQDFPLDFVGGEMGSVLLIDCDPSPDMHIHEFGMLVAETLNFAGEFGQTAKYSFVTVDEELIPIHHLTKSILQTGLPFVEVVKT